MEELRLLSELLEERDNYFDMLEETEDEDVQEIIGLALDCIECKLMYGDYICDVEGYDYWNED